MRCGKLMSCSPCLILTIQPRLCKENWERKFFWPNKQLARFYVNEPFLAN